MSVNDKKRKLAEVEGDTSDLRVTKISPLIPPCLLLEELPLSDAAHETVIKGREEVTKILNGLDNRLLVVVVRCLHRPSLSLSLHPISPNQHPSITSAIITWRYRAPAPSTMK